MPVQDRLWQIHWTLPAASMVGRQLNTTDVGLVYCESDISESSRRGEHM